MATFTGYVDSPLNVMDIPIWSRLHCKIETPLFFQGALTFDGLRNRPNNSFEVFARFFETYLYYISFEVVKRVLANVSSPFNSMSAWYGVWP